MEPFTLYQSLPARYARTRFHHHSCTSADSLDFLVPGKFTLISCGEVPLSWIQTCVTVNLRVSLRVAPHVCATVQQCHCICGVLYSATWPVQSAAFTTPHLRLASQNTCTWVFMLVRTRVSIWSANYCFICISLPSSPLLHLAPLLDFEVTWLNMIHQELLCISHAGVCSGFLCIDCPRSHRVGQTFSGSYPALERQPLFLQFHFKYPCGIL